jgi:hypothetical protein
VARNTPYADWFETLDEERFIAFANVFGSGSTR